MGSLMFFAFALGLIAVASCAVVLFLAGRVNETAFDINWQDLATPAGGRAFHELRTRFAMEGPVMDLAIGRPARIGAAGNQEEAVRLFVTGYKYMASLAADRDQLLRGMARYSRMVGALMPLPPLARNMFRFRTLSTLAGLSGIAHYMLVTVPERFRFRLAVLRCGFVIVLRALARQRTEPTPKWAVFVDVVADWHTLDAETLESFGALVTAVTIPEIKQAVAARQA